MDTLPIISSSLLPVDGARPGPRPSPDMAAITTLIEAWRAGQLLQARAATPTDPAGRLLLQLGELEIPARSNVPIAGDQPLRLEVAGRQGRLLLLRILNQLPLESKPALAPFLRTVLPRQGEPAELLRTLNVMVRRPPVSLPRSLKASIQALQQGLTPLERLREPGQLLQAVRNSGQFMENRLASGSAPAVATDFKARLLQLAGEIRRQRSAADAPRELTEGLADDADGRARGVEALAGLFRKGRLAPPQLARLLLGLLPAEKLNRLVEALQVYANEGRLPRMPPEAGPIIHALRLRGRPRASAATLQQQLRLLPLLDDLQSQVDATLARIQSNQLLSMAREGAGIFLMLDLPLRLDDNPATVRLQLEDARPGAGGDEEDRKWRITLNFDLAALGPLEVRVALRGERLHTRFQAGRAGTVPRIRAALPALHQALQGLGLRLDRIELAMKANEGRTSTLPAAPAGILDERA
ncbi:MAG TPA: flagellar hook-length control protein FliK [Gammaproteobacteria bacterium]|nr:flagellar hook-length control protein FliK [Gammaproteobacteria bacterium]